MWGLSSMYTGVIMSDNKSRVLRVSDVWDGRKLVPMIRIRGDWLRTFGFSVGDKYEVLFGFDDSLILKRQKDENI